MNIFLNDNLHVGVYIAALDKLYGREYLDFEPETFRLDLGTPDRTLDKIMAGIVLKTTSTFWNDIVAFEKVAIALNNRLVSFDEYQTLSPAEIAWAVVEAGHIAEPEPFQVDIEIYIAKRLHDAGYSATPEPLGEIQSRLDAINELDVFNNPDAATDNLPRRQVEELRLTAVAQYVANKFVEFIKQLKTIKNN